MLALVTRQQIAFISGPDDIVRYREVFLDREIRSYLGRWIIQHASRHLGDHQRV